MTSYDNELKIALGAVKKAFYLCSRAQKNLVNDETIKKKDRSPVTIADFGSQAIINIAITDAFPDAVIIAEEDTAILRKDNDLKTKVVQLVNEQMPNISSSRIIEGIDAGSGTGSRFWTVDPIDGTKGFLRGDQYAVALALIENGEVVLGILGCPNFPINNETKAGCMFYAVKGSGAYMYFPDSETKEIISVDRDIPTQNARVCESVESAHAAHDIHAGICNIAGIKAPPFRMDSQAKYAAVACGKASVYLRLPRSKEYREKIWDHAAGSIIVEEAGGRVTDFSGSKLDFTKGQSLVDNTGILVTNGSLHDKVLKAIASV